MNPQVFGVNTGMARISAVIITFNEEKCIERCIDSAYAVADDIVVVDSFSTDKTKQICIEKGVRFFEREFTGYSDQKNFGNAMAKFDHILSLDADEYLSKELEDSILEIKEFWTDETFCMSRLSSYGGKWIRHGSWYPDKQLRLWNRNFGEWGGENPHEKVQFQIPRKVIHLKGDLLHQSYDDASITLNKIQLYSGLYASHNVGKKNPSVFSILVHTIYAFFKSYILKRGFLDGYEGLIVAIAITNHTFYKYTKLYEANRYKSRNEKRSDQSVKFKELELQDY